MNGGEHADESQNGSRDQYQNEHTPGRIPESLIDAALDGEISDQMQSEIAHALQYDSHRRAELMETADAVRALDLGDIPMPDMQCAVLNRLDGHNRFIPRSMRKKVRTGRITIAAGVLLGLMLVAGLQAMYPRLSTLGAQSTPVHDVASAIQSDTQHVASELQSGVANVRATFAPLDGLLSAPKTTSSKTFTLTVNHQLIRFTESDLEALRASGVDHRGLAGLNAPRYGQMSFVRYSGDERSKNTQPMRGVFLSNGPDGLSLIQWGGQDGQRSDARTDREKVTDERIADLP
ncbi:MAG: anti-sigma factor [Phycisphaerales bacterium]